MNAESLDLLEYGRLLELTARYAGSEAGRRLLRGGEPSTDRAAIEAGLEEAAEAMAYLDAAAQPAPGRAAPAPLKFDSIPDCGAAVARLRIEGAVLEALEVSAICSLLERAAEVRLALGPYADRHPRLAARAASIGDFRAVLRGIAGKILPDGSIASEASVALGRIRREIARQNGQIQASLERFLRLHREDGLLQEEFIAIRNGRFVVPVIPGAKKRLPGVVHGASGSGQTLFLEPLDTIDLNNGLVRLAEEESREIHRILRELSAELRAHAGAIGHAAAALAALDAVFAKARFAREFDCTIPRFAPPEAPRLLLREARHPLLEEVLRRRRMRPVPASLDLAGGQRTLLISGPNTGGKTVAIKTVGLLAAMAQSALPVPAAEAELPLFGDVLADIGDNQSIEQSLSSFSAHVTRIREMAEAAPAGALVLLDELGRATDPEEGGALGAAVLDEFRRRGCFTLASTHLLALKVYGANTPGVLNASMGFSEETLEPTYVLRTGAPGKSAGLDIAARLGLPAHLIARARAAMSSTGRDIAAFLNQLETRIGEAAAEAEELRRRTAALEEREKRFREEMESREQARLREIAERAAEARKRFEEEANAVIGRVLGEPALRRAAERALRQVARTKRELHESVEALKEPGKLPPKPERQEIGEGARVRLKDVSGPARVRRVLAAGMLEVEVGLLKMQAPVADVVEILPEARASAGLPKGVSFQGGPSWDTLAREINVIGMNAGDACSAVDRLLDSAILAGVARLRVVHGHGMGVLRKAIHELLRGHREVAKFYPAPGAEGGTGATIVELKE
jgi:DNA mismatch repair protein MutS2